MIVSKVFHYKTHKKGVRKLNFGLKFITGVGYFVLEINKQENQLLDSVLDRSQMD